MNRPILKDALGWGFILWLIGYGLGIMLFMVVPPSLIGWIIAPIGVAITLWVLFKKVSGNTLGYYIFIGIAWVFIAVVCDYFFLYKAFNPADGYYKFDVYLYYVLTLILPVAVGWWKTREKATLS